LNKWLQFIGSPLIALLIGLALSLLLIKKQERSLFERWMKEGAAHAGPILILVGAGGSVRKPAKKNTIS
jgi:GntP family gluconate:H+ symporter